MSKKKKRGRDGGAPEPGYALPTPPPEKRPPEPPPSKGMTIDAILAQLASMKDNAKSSIGGVGPEGDAIWQTDVDACEAAAAILSALQDEGLNDPEQVRDMIYDYRALAEQYQTMRQHYIEPAKPERLGAAYICPNCKKQLRQTNAGHCWACGKRLNWFLH